MQITLLNLEETLAFGEQIGHKLRNGAVLELVGDIGAGKTTLVKGIARGLGVVESVQSPTFTISRQYETSDERVLVHYDFYRLSDAGIMRDELAELVDTPGSVVVLEWAELVDGVLPADRLTIRLEAVSEESRRVTISAGGAVSERVLRSIE